jgi:hypothetical protein
MNDGHLSLTPIKRVEERRAPVDIFFRTLADSKNEELRASAGELETSREELQSLNEELTTVNQELKIEIEELSQANDDFKNLMSSTNIGTIFLDRALCLKLFTPRGAQASPPPAMLFETARPSIIVAA